MQTSQLFKYSFLFLLSLSVNANDNYISFDQKFMDADWDFLPDVPTSFNENYSEEIHLGLKFKNIKASFYSNEIELILKRPTEPKDVSLFAQKEGLNLGYVLKDTNYFYLIKSKQTADSQTFDCFEFSTFILGSCDSANLRIGSNNPKYDVLEENIIGLSGSTKTSGIGYKKYLDNFWLESVIFEIVNTEYSYDWLSPLEDIESPFLLNLSIDGIRLGDALNSIVARLPQRDMWETLQLNIGLRQEFVSFYNFSLIAEYDFVILEFSQYREYESVPDINFKIRGGIEFFGNNVSLMIYGDAYLNNLIGFEPITFNQRTEHYFDQSYGELGIAIKLNF